MGMTGFSDAEMALLSGLDAVAWVRASPTDSFDARPSKTLPAGPKARQDLPRGRAGPAPHRQQTHRTVHRPVETRTAGRRDDAPARPGRRRRQGGRPAPMSVVLAQTMRINALEERLRRLELGAADGTAR